MNLKDVLKQKLSAVDYDNLPALLKIKSNRCTRILKNPALMVKEEVANLATVLNVDPLFLISTYQCGFEILTLNDLSQLEALELDTYSPDLTNINNKEE